MPNFYTDNPDLRFHLTHPVMERIIRMKERDFADSEKYDYAPVDVEDAMDSYDRILEIVGEVCGELIAPGAAEVDSEGPAVVDGRVVYASGTRKNLDALVQAGLMGMALPREYNGLNFPGVPYIMAADIVSRADAGFVNIWGLQDCAETIHEFASAEQKAEYLPQVAAGATMAMDLTEPDAGSDLQAAQLKASWDENRGCWLLNGVKRFITNGDGDISLVLARSEPGTKDGRGLSMFIHHKKTGGVTVRRIEHKMGIIGSPTCELVFKDAPAELVGDRKMGLIKYVMALMNGARLGIAAQSVGISEAAYREALRYASGRIQFGKPVIRFPAVYEMVASMKARLDASRTLLYETARFVDLAKAFARLSEERKLEAGERQEMKEYQRLADFFTPLVKGMASEFCNQIAYDAVQVHGGSGFMKDYPVERIYRDARITSIYEGTTQLQVVAAIRGVTTGAFLARIRYYETLKTGPELASLRRTLIIMTDDFEHAVSHVLQANDSEYADFHARRMVEMAGWIIMGHLLALDADRDNSRTGSARIFVRMARAAVRAHADFIGNCSPDDLGHYKFNQE